MLSTLLTVALSLITLSSASTLPNYRRGSGLLRLPVTALNLTEPQQLPKRQHVVPTVNTETGTFYVVSLDIGTPPQPVTLQLDTGSSDTWVDPTCSTAGSASSIAVCNSYPVYKVGLSSTSVDTGIPMSLSYGIGTAHGEYYTDNFLLGGASILAQQFGVASSTADIRVGLMGVGPGIELTGYPTIIDQLALQGIINSRAFSLDLRGVDSPDGAVIFGGIDTGKYTGKLEKRPIIPVAQTPDDFDRYWIYMTSVGITKPGAAPKLYPPSSGNPNGQAVFLDSGGTLSRLPTALFNAIVADFPSATPDPSGSGLYLVPCAVASQAGTIDFGFGNTIIHVPYHEFIWFSGPTTCYLGIAANDFEPVLGDSFLRAAYVVYDQDNQNLLLANAANCGTNLVAIGKGPDAVPSSTGACGASSTSSSASSSSTLSSSSSSSSSLTSSSTSSKITSSSSSSSTASSTSSTSSSKSSANSGSSSVASTSSSLATTVTPSSASTTSITSLTLSTVYTTKTYTITSCAPTITNCPYGHLTTETVSLYTTYCPITPLAPTPTSVTGPNKLNPYTTSTVYATTTYTITSCAPTVTNCPYGSTTTSSYALYTTVCPVAATEVATSLGSTETNKPTSVVVSTAVAPTLAMGPVNPSTPSSTKTASISVAPLNPTPKASGMGVSAVQFTGGTVAMAVNFAAIVMAAVAAAAAML